MKEWDIVEGIDELRALYREIDREAAACSGITGWRCPPGCGHCCHSPVKNIEASIFEVMPLALDLWERGEGEAVLERLEGLDDESVCGFFRPVADVTAPGHCSVYALRPLVCRLFGLYSSPGKRGEPINRFCFRMDRGGSCGKPDIVFPSITDFSRHASSLHPFLGAARHPLNRAVTSALTIIGMRRFYGKDG
jgi:Fe-S-cluster containining protein